MWRLEADSGKETLGDAIWRTTRGNLRGLIFATCLAEKGSANRFSAGRGPTDALGDMIRQITGKAKYRMLMSGLSEATQKRYFRIRARWMTPHHWGGKRHG